MRVWREERRLDLLVKLYEEKKEEFVGVPLDIDIDRYRVYIDTDGCMYIFEKGKRRNDENDLGGHNGYITK